MTKTTRTNLLVGYVRVILCYQGILRPSRVFKRNMNKWSEKETSEGGSEENQPSFITEGKCEIMVSPTKNVFYNPVQEFNRDLSVAVLTCLAEEQRAGLLSKKPKFAATPDSQIVCNKSKTDIEAGKVYEDGIVILEALSASGLRSIRYAKEIPGVKEVIANDISESAANSIRDNVEHNHVKELVTVSHNDAIMVMYDHRHPLKRVHAVDLDPYGCPTPFLDAAVQCITDGGLLLVTCTDMAVLAGNSPETCHAKYGAISLRNKACHEMALRIVLQCIESHANRYGRYTVPVLSISADFYVRVFVKIYTGPAMCKRSVSKLSLVYQCVGCETHVFHPLGVAQQNGEKITQCKFSLPYAPTAEACEHCGHRFHIGGPIWNAPIHDTSFVRKLLDAVEHSAFGTSKRMRGVLTMVEEELPEVPLYFSLDRLFSTIRAETMSMLVFRSALMNAGYCVSFSHTCKKSVKTNAPAQVVWDIVRTWEKYHPVRHERLSEAGRNILAKLPATEISLEVRPDANPDSRERGLVRFQENPRPYWGPGTRSKMNFQTEDKVAKSFSNQGKRSRSQSNSPHAFQKSAKHGDNDKTHDGLM